MVDKEAFGKLDEQTFILKQFWNSQANKIVVARKSDTKSIVGYACYLEMDGGCYLMRIGVRSKCQRQGIGRKLMDYLFNKYPKHLSLDVSIDNTKAVSFYLRCGLQVTKTYLSEEKTEFNTFETPKGFKPTIHKFSQQASDVSSASTVISELLEEVKIQNVDKSTGLQMNQVCFVDD
jgi:GNAT superfamily N-acetyltransferase